MSADETRWVEVNLDHIQHNLKTIKAQLGHTRLLAVVKADAYGHGMIPVTRLVIEAGANYLGVATADEALTLRSAGIDFPVLIMSSVLSTQYHDLISAACTLTVHQLEEVQQLHEVATQLGCSVRVHINVNVGMYRYGASPDQVLALAQKIQSSPLLELEGVYTHFPHAEDKSATLKQFARFKQVLDELEANHINVALRHCANSTATASLKETWLDMVRVGTLLFGQCRVPTALELKPTWQLNARVTSMVDVPKGQAIGYGQTYRVKRHSRIAIIPLGFADGISMWPVHRKSTLKELLKDLLKSILRYFGVNRTIEKALINDHSVPYIGKVGMQHLSLDVTDFSDIKIGDRATVRILQATVNALLPKRYVTESSYIAIGEREHD